MFPKDTKFLVIDDFATMRKIVEKMLVELGYSDIWEAADGTSALVMLQRAAKQQAPFGLVIADWNMPNGTGIDLLRACRENSLLKDTPFIMITCESEHSNIIEAAQLGVSDYAVKPFSSKVFEQKLSRVWQKVSAPKKAG